MNKSLLEQFALKAEERAQSKLEIAIFEVGGIPTEFKKLSLSQQLEYYEAFTEANTSTEILNNVCKSLIYDSCPALQDTELHKTVGVVEPYDIVNKLIDLADIDELGLNLMRWNGILKDKKNESETKN